MGLDKIHGLSSVFNWTDSELCFESHTEGFDGDFIAHFIVSLDGVSVRCALK
jgi:hypothetical protein